MDLGFAFRRRRSRAGPDLRNELNSLLGSHGVRQAMTPTALLQAGMGAQSDDDTRIDLFSRQPGQPTARLADAQFAHLDDAAVRSVRLDDATVRPPHNGDGPLTSRQSS